MGTSASFDRGRRLLVRPYGEVNDPAVDALPVANYKVGETVLLATEAVADPRDGAAFKTSRLRR
jgi:hypothetical protein